jgi:transcriptional regulator with XRE-family HTH domain
MGRRVSKTLRGKARGSISSRLRKIRHQLGYSQKRMASFFGMGANAYGKTETGYSSPGLKQLYIFATQFNISLDWLVCGRGTMHYDKPEQGAAGPVKDELSREIEEMSELMKKVPLIRHLVLGKFQELKLDYRDVIREELEETAKET